MECRLAGKTEVLGENLSQRHFCPSQNPTWPDPGLKQSPTFLSLHILYLIKHWPHRKRRIQDYFSVACVIIAAGMCLPSGCLATAVPYASTSLWAYRCSPPLLPREQMLRVRDSDTQAARSSHLFLLFSEWKM
jgi:hypothetical protein